MLGFSFHARLPLGRIHQHHPRCFLRDYPEQHQQGAVDDDFGNPLLHRLPLMTQRPRYMRLSIDLVRSLFSEPEERALLIRALIAGVLQRRRRAMKTYVVEAARFIFAMLLAAEVTILVMVLPSCC